jgi:hypothetical protein
MPCDFNASKINTLEAWGKSGNTRKWRRRELN